MDQEEEDRRKQEVEAARATEDGNLDDSLDADDIPEVHRLVFFSLSQIDFIQCLFFRSQTNENQLIHRRKKV